MLLLLKNSFKTTKKGFGYSEMLALFLPDLGFVLLLKLLWLRSRFEGWEKWIVVKSMCLFHFTQLKTCLFFSVRFYPKYIAPVNWT